jgi:bacterioferritin-associated ferredoxin
MAHPLTFVCRCEDVTEEEIVNLITEGYSTLSELKQFLRVGMGECQGRCCRELVLEIISREKKIEKKDILPPTIRAPIKPVSMKVLKTLKI